MSSIRLTRHVVFLGPHLSGESWTNRKSINLRKPGDPAIPSRQRILTAAADVDEEVALEDGTSLQHLSRSDRIDGLRFLFFLTDLGTRTFARDAVHAVEDKEPTANTEVRVSPCIEKKKNQKKDVFGFWLF